MSLTKNQWLEETGGFPLKGLLFAKPLTLQRPTSKISGPKVAFDIETDLIRSSFSRARTSAQRVRNAPAPSLACAYSSESRKFTYYGPKEFPALLRLLRKANEVITFNGEGFDFYVLAKVLSISVDQLRIKQSTDLFRVIKDSTSLWASLNNLALVNLGKGKHTAGNAIPNLDPAAIRAACKSDVAQTYRLYRRYVSGTLQVPLISLSKKHYREMPFGGVCPVCRDAASIVEMPTDTSQMTEGQALPYLYGEFGTSRCTTCNTFFMRGDA